MKRLLNAREKATDKMIWFQHFLGESGRLGKCSKRLKEFSDKLPELHYFYTQERPTIRDIFDSIYVDTGREYLGFMNSDLILTEKFRESLKDGHYDIAWYSRLNVDEYGNELGYMNSAISADCFIMRRGVWEIFRDRMSPCLVPGIPWWDSTLITMAIGWRPQLKIQVYSAGEILHVEHEQAWDPRATACQEAKKAYRDVGNSLLFWRGV